MVAIRDTTELPKDENSGPALLAITVTLAFLVIVTTCLRVYVRWAYRILGWDDYTIIITAVLATARMGVQSAMVHYGNGRHRVYLPEDDYIKVNMLGWYAQILLFATTATLKTSICLLMKRFTDSKKLNYVLYAVMAGLYITNFGIIFILIAQCKPVSKYWLGPEIEGVCWDIRIRIYAIYITIAYNILTDIICSLLPLVVLWKANFPLKKKLAVWGLMSLGLLTTGFGIGRASSLGFNTDDLTWTYAIAALWSNLELFLGIIAANLALSRSIVTYFFRETEELTATRSTPRHTYGTPRIVAEYSELDSPSSIALSSCGRRSVPNGVGEDISSGSFKNADKQEWNIELGQVTSAFKADVDK